MATLRQIERQIARVLNATAEPGSRNRIDLTEVREWAVEYLNRYDEELERFPDVASLSHWDLWMRDTTIEGAFFAVIIVRIDGLEFFCGRGNAFAIKSFSEHFPGDPSDLLKELRDRFVIPNESVMIDRESAERWLGRSLGLH